MTKCERCGAEYEYVKGVYSPGWCQRCGHGSPAEIEQRERATRAATLNMAYNESLGRCSEDFLSVTKERDQLRTELANERSRASHDMLKNKDLFDTIQQLRGELAVVVRDLNNRIDVLQHDFAAAQKDVSDKK